LNVTMLCVVAPNRVVKIARQTRVRILGSRQN
jgi:hypothetical protein